jgi:hypothetical protein
MAKKSAQTSAKFATPQDPGEVPGPKIKRRVTFMEFTPRDRKLPLHYFVGTNTGILETTHGGRYFADIRFTDRRIVGKAEVKKLKLDFFDASYAAIKDGDSDCHYLGVSNKAKIQQKRPKLRVV